MTVSYKYLSWYRAGAAALIRTPDAVGPTVAAHFQTRVQLQVGGRTVTMPVDLFGPGDAAGLEPEQIVRRLPAPGALGCEVNFFPMLELRDPDLPWRLTPVGPGHNDRLRPWLALIALPQQPDVQPRRSGRAPLPVITVPRDELPDLTEAALWAHVQVRGPFPADVAGSIDPVVIANFVRANPGCAIARLLCPRRLAPNTRYLVCLVPTFEAGRRAGLGEEFDEQEVGLTLAWSPAGPPVPLPVYDAWSFATGAATDPAAQFETLARSLQPHVIPADAARRTFTLDIPLADGTTQRFDLPLQGALRPVSLPPVAPPPAAAQNALKAWVNRAADSEDQGGAPHLTPPLYAGRQARQRRAGAAQTPRWFNELNLYPHNRIAAALGGDLVQRHQDEFMAEAWRQAGELRQANALLRGAQLARSANHHLKARFLAPLPPDQTLQVAGPVRARLTAPTGATLAQTVTASAVPAAGFESAFRRATRSRGPHLRRWALGVTDSGAERLFKQGYERVTLTDWQAVDASPKSTPSEWVHVGADIEQRKDIYATPLDAFTLSRLGTMYVAGNGYWQDYQFLLNIRSNDTDNVGFVFRYKDAKNYYRFSLDQARLSRRLVKCVNGAFTLLWSEAAGYSKGSTYRLQLHLEGDQIRLTMDTRLLFDLRDNQLERGAVGLYTWNNAFARFSGLDLRVQQGLSRADLPTAVFDQGVVSAPSRWTTVDGKLVQTGDIHSPPVERNHLDKLGTLLRIGGASWKNYAVGVDFTAEDDDDVGVSFRYRSSKNHYRFSMSLERRYLRLVKCVDGVFSLLWQRDEGIEKNRYYRLYVVADGTRLRGYLDGRRLFDLRDRAHPIGHIALYCYAMSKVTFHSVGAYSLRRETIMTRLNASQLGLPVPAGSHLNLAALGAAVLAGVDPELQASARALDRLQLPNGPNARDPLGPVRAAPEISLPLGERLAAAAPFMLLPGLDGAPDNAIVLLETNPEFVAALLAGANHEMGRELLWRNFDADPGGTVFRQFWDVRGGAHGNATPAQREAHKDIPPIANWNASRSLAEQAGSRGAARTVFLLRSELIQRFPEARFYLLKAEAVSGGRQPGAVAELYQFQGQLGETTRYFGFNRAPAEVSGADGGPGWYFVIEQPPLGERYGLRLEGPAAPADWTDVGWNHLPAGAYAQGGGLTLPAPPPGPSWGRNAAHMAAITRRRPFRLLIHAGRLLTQPAV